MLFQIEVHRYNRGGPTLSSTVCSVQVVGACDRGDRRSILSISNIFEALFPFAPLLAFLVHSVLFPGVFIYLFVHLYVSLFSFFSYMKV